jgi:hypothetical protein
MRRFAVTMARGAGLVCCPRHAVLPLPVLAVALAISAVPKNSRRGNAGARPIAVNSGAERIQALPGDAAGHEYSITDFSLDHVDRTARFVISWADGLFTHTLTRNLYLYASTNLAERRWSLLGVFPVPVSAISPYALTVTQNSVFEAMRPRFLDTFGGAGFYRFEIDLDSDGDSLSDARERELGTDPNLEDTDGDGIADGVEVNIHGTNPVLADTDGDGLTDFDELLHGTSQTNRDSDGDGLLDGWEVANFLNPRSAEGNDGAEADIDRDGLTNLEEQSAGSNPMNPDTDGDWLSDSQELALGTNPCAADTDGDGLSDGLEQSLGINPLQPDSDSDGMNDGWEHRHRSAGFDPALNNAADGNPNNDIGADQDYDGLANGQECEWGANPSGADTDGDGVGDGAEIGQNSDPTDAGDEGRPNTRVPVSFHFGDPSDSHSEKYRLEVAPVAGIGGTPSTFSWLNENYGQCESRTAMLKPGWKYEVRLHHAGTNSGGSPDYDYRLDCGSGALPPNIVVDDPSALFGTDYTSYSFAGAGKVATVAVHAVTGVTICTPDDSSWTEMEESRVVLDDEELRIKIEIAPQLDSIAQCRRLFGDALTMSTSGTCPAGVSMQIPEDAAIVNSPGRSEIRITKTRQQLISLGLLPQNDEDGVSEMTWLDMANPSSGSGQNLLDSEAFAGLAHEDRGRASRDPASSLASAPSVSAPSESYFKAAGREIIVVSYGNTVSSRRQIMNQADYFYYSGHGHHAIASLQGDFTPAMARLYWNRDLDVAIIAACSVLDINDYNGLAGNAAASPGKVWEQAGPGILLGYNYVAPGDAGGAPERIMRFWVANRGSLGDVDAWMEANARNKAWNACAVVKGQKYVYFRKSFWGVRKIATVNKEDW